MADSPRPARYLSLMAVSQHVQLSERVRRLPGSATLAVNARVKELAAAGEDIIGFGAGEPDFDTPANIKQAAIDALLAGKTKYAPVPGEPEAREVIARKLRDENNIECSARDIVISVGGKHSIYLALQCLIDPRKNEADEQQEVILPTPAWVSYAPMIQLAGGKAVEVAGSVDDDFLVAPEQIESAITENTLAIIINSPSNPCGTMYAPGQLHAIADVIERHDHIAIITDEMYEKLIYGDIAHFSLGSLSSIADRVITVGGLSKAYAMTGWRIGYACAPGNDGGVAKAMANLQSQMTSNITSFCYAAIVEALTKSAADVERMRQTFAARATLIHELVSAMPGVVCPKPTGAFYVFPDISACFGKTSPAGTKIDSAVSFATALLDEAKVAVVPGDDFGQCATGHVRLSFACSNEQIREGCRRMHEWIASLRR
jgi:aspartate aminotransferase